MTDDRSPPAEHRWPSARRIHRRWPGIVWALPLAALLVVAYLGVHAFFRRGIEVTVTFANGLGVTPTDTKVIENGVEVGHVTAITNTADGKLVRLTLSMDRKTESALNSNSVFWLIGEQPSITDIQSLRAAIAGLSVGLAPGVGGTPKRDFTGFDSVPLVMPGTRGHSFTLESDHLGSLQAGAALLYQGQRIGVVTKTALQRVDDFSATLFVNAPYDQLVKPGAIFWRGSAVKFGVSGSGIEAQLSSPGSLLTGSIQFDLPKTARGGAVSPPGTSFPLYDDEAGARHGPTGPEVLYDLIIAGAAGDLTDGAPVSLLGYTIGEVRSARMVFAPGSRKPYTAATIAIYPLRLDVTGPASDDASAWRASTDAAVGRLLAGGYRASLTQTIPLVGAHAIAFTQVGGHAALIAANPRPIIPTSGASTDVTALIGRLSSIPIEQIGENVRQLTGNLAHITGSHEVNDGLKHLDATLGQLDQITHQVQPQIGPLMTSLNQTATQLQATAAAASGALGGGGANQDQSLPEAIRQLTEAARSIRSLTDYLGRHPEALLRGKGKEKQ